MPFHPRKISIPHGSFDMSLLLIFCIWSFQAIASSTKPSHPGTTPTSGAFYLASQCPQPYRLSFSIIHQSPHELSGTETRQQSMRHESLGIHTSSDDNNALHHSQAMNLLQIFLPCSHHLCSSFPRAYFRITKFHVPFPKSPHPASRCRDRPNRQFTPPIALSQPFLYFHPSSSHLLALNIHKASHPRAVIV